MDQLLWVGVLVKNEAGLRDWLVQSKSRLSYFVDGSVQLNEWMNKNNSRLMGFEPTTSEVPSQCTTNWAIQAWKIIKERGQITDLALV